MLGWTYRKTEYHELDRAISNGRIVSDRGNRNFCDRLAPSIPFLLIHRETIDSRQLFREQAAFILLLISRWTERRKDGRFEEGWKTWGLRLRSNFEQREKRGIVYNLFLIYRHYSSLEIASS